MSNYSDLISNSIGKVYQTNVANKILQFMDKIRNESDLKQARRWVMELLQNAKDTAYDQQYVNVQIELTEEELQFRHTGKAFRVKDILSIIHQVSSKTPGEGNTGKFGTGFMSTYQLSEVIELESYLHEEGLSYRKFHVTLDRTGHTKEEILEAIEDNLRELKGVDEADKMSEEEYDITAYHTSFRYHLKSDYNRRIALTGMDDLMETIRYILLFSEKIGSVELIYNLPERKEKILFKRGDVSVLQGGLRSLSVVEQGQARELIYMTREYMGSPLYIAAECQGMKFRAISEKTPRVFIDFPLIGAEEFPFPIVMNHYELKPNEPRSGITLVENENSIDAKINQKIVDEAVEMYAEWLHAVVQQDYQGLEHVLAIAKWKVNTEWSANWVRQHLYDNLYQIVSKERVLPIGSGRMSLAEEGVKLLKADSEVVRAQMIQLLSPLANFYVPQDEIDWYGAFSGYVLEEEKWIDLEGVFAQAETILCQYLDLEKCSVLAWCQELYNVGMHQPQLAVEICAGDRAIFLSQEESEWKEKKLRTIAELYQDPDIPEILKDVSEKLDQFGVQQHEEPLHLRANLLHKEFKLVDEKKMPKYELTRLTEYISKRSSRQFRVSNYMYHSNEFNRYWREAWELMIACGPNAEIYNLCQTYWGKELPERKELEVGRFGSFLWSITYQSVLGEMRKKLEEYDKVVQFFDALGVDCAEGYEWLNMFYQELLRWLSGEQLKLKTPVPNQEGALKYAYTLYKDELQPELKEIAKMFCDQEAKCQLAKVLVDQKVDLKDWDLLEKKNDEIASVITNVIQKLLSEKSLAEADLKCQEACTRLLGWISEHDKLAKNYFPAFYNEEDRMKLLTTKAAVQLNKKAQAYSKLLEEIGCEDEDKLYELLQKGIEQQKEEKEREGYVNMYDDEFEIAFGKELLDFSQEERREYLRVIGEEGERYAVTMLKNKLMLEGFGVVEEQEGLVELEKLGTRAQIIRKDDQFYHQPGWDVMVKYIEKDSETVDFYEVKTHTTTSRVASQLKISNEQMVMAAQYMEHYSVLKMSYDFKRREIVTVKEYKNPIRQLSLRKLVNLDGGYLWREV